MLPNITLRKSLADMAAWERDCDKTRDIGNRKRRGGYRVPEGRCRVEEGGGGCEGGVTEGYQRGREDSGGAGGVERGG